MRLSSRIGSITLLGSTLFAASAGTDAAETPAWTQLTGQEGLACWRTPAGPFRGNPDDPWVDAGSASQDADDEKPTGPLMVQGTTVPSPTATSGSGT